MLFKFNLVCQEWWYIALEIILLRCICKDYWDVQEGGTVDCTLCTSSSHWDCSQSHRWSPSGRHQRTHDAEGAQNSDIFRKELVEKGSISVPELSVFLLCVWICVSSWTSSSPSLAPSLSSSSSCDDGLAHRLNCCWRGPPCFAVAAPLSLPLLLHLLRLLHRPRLHLLLLRTYLHLFLPAPVLPHHLPTLPPPALHPLACICKESTCREVTYLFF